MKNQEKVYLAATLAAIMIGLSACSHNTSGFTVGTRINAGLDPQNATANISYTDGLNVIDVSRENSTWSLEVDGDTGLSYDEQSGSVKGVRKIRRSVGPQITGYLVELAEKHPEAALEYTKSMRAYWEAVEAAKRGEEQYDVKNDAAPAEETAASSETDQTTTAAADDSGGTQVSSPNEGAAETESASAKPSTEE